MKAVGQARLQLRGVSTPDHLWLRPVGSASSALHAWPANMQSRRESQRVPRRRPVILKSGPQIKSNQIPSPKVGGEARQPPCWDGGRRPLP